LQKGIVNSKRSFILKAIIIFSFIAVSLRLADIMIVNHGYYTGKAKKQQFTTEDIRVRRGAILDRNGRELALNLELESLYCDPKTLYLDEENTKVLASAMSKKPAVILSKVPDSGRFAWIERKLDPAVAAKIRALKIRGLGFVPEAKRYYPGGEIASHIIGLVDVDNRALEGIEMKYDKYLTTTGGKVSMGRDASGKILSSGIDLEAKGNNVLLTIDSGLQYIVETEIGKAVRQWNAAAASVIMMDPLTGEILALANRPTYDPNVPGRVSPSERRNRAITDLYEPGSTFKIVIGLGALEEKLVRPESLFDVSRGAIDVGGKTIHDVHKNGVLTFREVIQKSSNVGSVMVGMKLGRERLYKYAKLLGVGDKSGIDLPGEVSGSLKPPERWSGTSHGAIPIGQEVAVTPLQILRAYSAVANGGYLVVPHIVSEIVSPDGRVLYSFMEKERRQIVSRNTAETFKDILKGVVDEGGTGKSASVEGNGVAGKTGTAQLIDPKTKRYSKDKFVSSFVGFVPADNPKLAMVVVVHEPKGQIYGGVVAAPVFRDIALQALSYLDVPREDDLQRASFQISR
jgi:cell division protein FtsI (penicillin-binding protein 3)